VCRHGRLWTERKSPISYPRVLVLVDMMEIQPLNHPLFQVANACLLASYCFRHPAWLRSCLLLSSLFFILWGWLILAISIDLIAWNALFFIINAVQLAWFWYENRPVKLTVDEAFAFTLLRRRYNLRAREFKHLASYGSWKTYSMGDVVLHEGKNVDRLGIVIRGTLMVKTDHTSESSDDPILVAELSRGSCYGELELFAHGDEFVAEYNVVACGNVTSLEWSASCLPRLAKESPELMNAIRALLLGAIALKLIQSHGRVKEEGVSIDVVDGETPTTRFDCAEARKLQRLCDDIAVGEEDDSYDKGTESSWRSWRVVPEPNPT
jgi:CRP-like cAMP-binding protein